MMIIIFYKANKVSSYISICLSGEREVNNAYHYVPINSSGISLHNNAGKYHDVHRIVYYESL